MLRCGMVGAGDVGGLWWLELTMEAACIHVSPMSRTALYVLYFFI
jgi:hypothetical protein